jgi:ferredoxin
MLVIDPDECIDCALCVPECPVNAIFADEDVPADQRDFIAENAGLAKKWPVIARLKPAPVDADEWADVKDKRILLDRRSAADPAPTPAESADSSDGKTQCA